MQSMATLTSIRTPPPGRASSIPRSAPIAIAGERLLALGLDDLFAAVIAVRADVMPQVHFPGGRLERQRRIGKRVVRTVHAALRRGFLVLLYCHVSAPCVSMTISLQRGQLGKRRAPGFPGFPAAALPANPVAMPRRVRKTQNDLILDQPGDIK